MSALACIAGVAYCLVLPPQSGMKYDQPARPPRIFAFDGCIFNVTDHVVSVGFKALPITEADIREARLHIVACPVPKK